MGTIANLLGMPWGGGCVPGVVEGSCGGCGGIGLAGCLGSGGVSEHVVPGALPKAPAESKIHPSVFSK